MSYEDDARKAVERMEEARLLAGLTRTEVAKRLDVSYQAVNNWVNRGAAPLPDNLERVRELTEKLEEEAGDE